MKTYLYKSLFILFLFNLSVLATGYKGVFVGINNYPGTNDLLYCVNDAQEIRSSFINNKGWSSNDCTILTEGSASETGIRDAIQLMPNNTSNITLFTFAGHGDSQELGGTDGLLPSNSTSARITPYELKSWFGTSHNQYAMILDACGTGCFTSNNKGVILTACDDDELAQESSTIQSGYFSHFISEGLAKSYVNTAEALFTYASPKTHNSNSSQQPQLKDNYAGNLNLMRNAPLKVSLTGSTSLIPSETGYWIASASCGNPPYRYTWYKMYYADASKSSTDPIMRAPQTGTYFQLGFTEPSISFIEYNADFRLKVRVTDATNNFIEDDIFVFYNSGGNFAAVKESGLIGNYPNPYNPSTKINYNIKEASSVNITVYDAVGRKVKELVNSHHESGDYSVDFNGGGLSSGFYFYTMRVNQFSQTKKMILTK